MEEEIEALKKNNTWTLVPHTQSMNGLSSKWVFKHKINEEGKIVRHKACLVAVGSAQKMWNRLY